MTEPTIIHRASQQAHEWFHAIQSELHLPEERSAYAALRAVLHALRDRVSPQEAGHLAAQLPTLVRGIYFEAWSPGKAPERTHDEEFFLAAVGDKLRDHPEVDPGAATRAVFALLHRHVSPGEIDHVIANLPRDLHGLWPQEALAHAARS